MTKVLPATIGAQILICIRKVPMLWTGMIPKYYQPQLNVHRNDINVIPATVGRHMAVLTTRGVDSSHKNMANVLPTIV